MIPRTVMSMENKVAIPAIFRTCYLAESSPPDLVKPLSEEVLSNSACIALELRDINKTIIEMLDENPSKSLFDIDIDAIENEPTDKGVVRVMLNLSDARALCCHLIHALSDTNDEISQGLSVDLDRRLEELRGEDESKSDI